MLSTHILDLSTGLPAQGVHVGLEMADAGSWSLLEASHSNQDGRISFKSALGQGKYRLNFHVAEYFKNNKQETFYDVIPVEFCIQDVSRKHHVPLLLSPFGYSTYRGS